MAEVDVGRALSGLGAAFKNEMPAFIQQVRQEDALALQQEDRNRAIALQDEELAEKRKITMFKDAQTGQQLLLSGDLAGVVALMEDRLNILGNVPNVDTKHTRNNLYLAKLAATGDKGAEQELTRQFDNAVTVGRKSNLIGSEMPSAFRSLELQAQAAGFKRGSAEYQRFMRFGGGSADEGAAKTEFFDNGAVLEKPRNGPPKLFVNGQQIVDPEEFAIQMDLAVASGPLLAGKTSKEQAMGGADAGRIQEAMNEGISAAEQIPNLRDALDLLDLMETGGINQVKFRMNRLTGITPADEGELNYLMSKNVLGQLKTIFGAAFTAQEGQLLRDIEANEGQSTEVNKRLIARALAALEVRADRGTMYATDLDRPMVIRDIEGFKNRDFMSYYDQQESSSGTDTPPQPDPDIPALNSRAGEDEMRRRGLIE
jgi:hypothetical protein